MSGVPLRKRGARCRTGNTTGHPKSSRIVLKARELRLGVGRQDTPVTSSAASFRATKSMNGLTCGALKGGAAFRHRRPSRTSTGGCGTGLQRLFGVRSRSDSLLALKPRTIPPKGTRRRAPETERKWHIQWMTFGGCFGEIPYSAPVLPRSPGEAPSPIAWRFVRLR